jgi:hypothetical protein
MLTHDKIQAVANQVRADAAARYQLLDEGLRKRVSVATYTAAAEGMFAMRLDDVQRLNGSLRLDADLLPVFARELESVMARVIEIPFPELRAASGDLFSFDSSHPYGAQSWTQYYTSTTGAAKAIAGHATDRPLVSAEGARVNHNFHSFALDYGWTYDELQAAALMPGFSLSDVLARGARRGHMQYANKAMLFGVPELSAPGLLVHPNVTQVLAADNGSGDTEWSEKQPDQIIADINLMINSVSEASLGVYQPNRVLLPRAQYDLIATTPRATFSDRTILEFVQGAHRGVSFEILNEMAAANSYGNLALDSAFVYNDAADFVQGVTAGSMFQSFSMQEKDLFYKIPCQSRIGGVRLVAPSSCLLMRGI